MAPIPSLHAQGTSSNPAVEHVEDDHDDRGYTYNMHGEVDAGLGSLSLCGFDLAGFRAA